MQYGRLCYMCDMLHKNKHSWKDSLVKKIICLVFLCWGSSAYAAGIDGNVDSIFMPELEIDWRVFQASKGHGTVFIRGSKGSGDFLQSIRAGETIEIEKTGDAFNGPASISTDVDLQTTYIGFNYSMYTSERFNWLFGAHAGKVSQSLVSTDGVQTVRYNQDFVGPIFLSLGGRYKFNSWIAVEGEGSVHMPIFETMFSFFGKDYINSLTDLHIKLSIIQNKNIQYSLGYRSIKYGYEDPDVINDPAALHLDYSGMYGGLSILF